MRMMPRSTGRPGGIGSGPTAHQTRAGEPRGTDQPRTCEPIIGRLQTEFVGLPHKTVERCVVDVWACAEHLGLAVTPVQVERVAREHLVGVVMSEPPSGR